MNFGRLLLLMALISVNAAAEPKIYFAVTDHLGTPQRLIDENQTVVWKADYKPFGEATVDEDPDGDGQNVEMPLRLPGQYYDAETGLHYNYFRNYDPRLGRFIQSDPIGMMGGLNTYAYVSNSPVNWIDPYGLAQYQGLHGIEQHLVELARRQGDDFYTAEYTVLERAMLERLKMGYEDPEDIAFYMHERAEAKACESLDHVSDELYMRVQSEAHHRVLREQGISDPHDLYHPEVKLKYPEFFKRYEGN